MKQKVPMICNIVSLILLIVFVIKSIVDYTQYSTSLNSAPFYLWVLVNALFLVIPAIQPLLRWQTQNQLCAKDKFNE